MGVGGDTLLTLSLLASVFLVASAFPTDDHRIIVPVGETTLDPIGVSATPQPHLHSIKERAALLLPVTEEENVDGRAPTEEEGEQEESVEGRECFRRVGTRRNSLDDNFMRFGRSNGKISSGTVAAGENIRKDSFSRNGRDRNFIRLGRSGGGNNFIRLGRRSSKEEAGEEEAEEDLGRNGRGSSNNFMRFGRRRQEEESDADNEDMERYSRTTLDRNFMRFGRSSSDLARSGRTQQQSANLDRNFMRLGRSRETPSASRSEEAMDRVYRASLDRNFMRFGRDRNFIRFGRGSGNNLVRFGKETEGRKDGGEEMRNEEGNSQRSKRSTGEFYEGEDPINREESEGDATWWGYPRYYQDLFLLPSYIEREGERVRRGRENFIRFG